MSRPQPAALAAFQRQRSAEHRTTVTAAIRELDRGAQPVTVAGVAALADVDRSYIYSHPDLFKEIQARRSTTPRQLAPRPAADRATIASLQARLASAHEEIARLKADNRKVRERLAHALGDTWEAELAGKRPRQTGTAAAAANVKLAAERTPEAWPPPEASARSSPVAF